MQVQCLEETSKKLHLLPDLQGLLYRVSRGRLNVLPSSFVVVKAILCQNYQDSGQTCFEMTVCIRQKLYRELSKVAQPLTQCMGKPLSIQNLFLIANLENRGEACSKKMHKENLLVFDCENTQPLQQSNPRL